MFSKAESRTLRREFWTSFGKSFPRKWILYNTRIKDFSFKFHFDTKKALVALDIESHNPEDRTHYYRKLESLKRILTEEYLPEVVFDNVCFLDNGKEISRIYVAKTGVSIHNKNSWRETMEFFNEKMQRFEAFYRAYEDHIKSQ